MIAILDSYVKFSVPGSQFSANHPEMLCDLRIT